jgi:site-specific DNA-methyltransferase (adenine-specific)
MEVMASIPANSIDAIVTDPPYGLGFMGKAWDDLPPGLEWAQECLRVLKPGGHLLAFGGTRTWHRLAVSVEDAGFEIRDSIAWMYGTGFPKGNSQMKPAFEPCVMGRKPFTGSMSANVAKHGTGTLQIDACRIECESRPVMVRTATQVAASSMSGVSTGATSNGEMTDTGRWPANVCLDDNMATVLDQQSGVTKSSAAHNKTVSMGKWSDDWTTGGHADEGGASRFFYVAKAPTKERPKVDGIAHPTVKPLTLMRWLVKLVTPNGGTVLDPFAGTGTTLEAAHLEGFKSIGIERECDYLPLIAARMKQHLGQEGLPA